MKLTNPTDDQLNAAFAEHVARWRTFSFNSANEVGHYWAMPDGQAVPYFSPTFTTSADAVLPWMDKYSVMVERVCFESEWEVRISDGDTEEDGTDNTVRAVADSFSRAAVIAMLRANGVEVEFTP